MRSLGAFFLVFLEAQIISQYFRQEFSYIFRKTMYNKTEIEFGFCDIRNNQRLGRGQILQKPHPVIVY